MLPLPLSHVLPSSELSREKMGKTAKERKGKQGGRTGDSSWQTASLNTSFSLSSRFVHPFPSPIAACFRMCVKAGREKKGRSRPPGSWVTELRRQRLKRREGNSRRASLRQNLPRTSSSARSPSQSRPPRILWRSEKVEGETGINTRNSCDTKQLVMCNS